MAELTQISQSFFKFDGPQGEAITAAAIRISVDAKAYGGDFDPKAFQAVADYLRHAGQMQQPFDTSRMAYKR